MKMLQIKLTEKQRKEFLKSFTERDMQKELKILFEKMYKTSVYILQGTNEFGKDLIIKKDEPMAGTRYISVVVKMGDIKGSVKDKQLFIVKNKIEQSFETNFYINDKIGQQKVNEVFVVLFGTFSNNAQKNIETFIDKHYPRLVTKYDINDMDKYFLEHYPEVFCGASGLEALTKKDEELDNLLLQKDRFLSESFIEPNVKRFNKNVSKDLSISNFSEEQRLARTITEGLFGVKESINTFAQKLLDKKQHILIEGEAGSGKSVFSIKLAQKFISIAIKKLSADKKIKKEQSIKVPVLITALELTTKSVDDLVQTYYRNSTYNFTPIVIIIDGLDELKKQVRLDVINSSIAYAHRENLSLIFTSRKNYNLIDNLDNFLHYEILAFEVTQAINYVKKLIVNNDTLLTALLKGLEQIEHQIPLYPMALSLLVEIVKEHNEVPASISELYGRYVNLVLGEKDSSKGIEVLFEYKIKKNFLDELSYDLFFKKYEIAIEYDSFYKFTENYVKSHPHISNTDNFIQELRRCSLLKFNDNKIEFLHKSFLDYFVADYFFSNRDELEDTDDFEKIYELYYDDFWNDIALFFFGIQTKITKQKLNKIIELGETKRKESESLFTLTELFMLGRLMQYAWDSKSEAKELVIKYASGIILALKADLLDLLTEGTGIKDLPTISSDIAILHLFDMSYSSLFLVREIENFITSNFNQLKTEEEINDNNDKALLYFSSVFVLTNHKIINRNFIETFFDDFLLIEKKVKDKEIVVPLIGLFNFILKKNLIEVDNKIKQDIEKEYKNLSKKLKHLIIKTFIVKNKNDTPYYLRRF
ncbi:MAG: NACHT domain-containing protein [Pseudomonadota bacterium]